MREILFKAKRVDNGEWVEGSLIIEEPPLQFPPKYPQIGKYLIGKSSFADWNMPRPFITTEVVPETVCQYTGLTDKNGVKIWEGDTLILREGDTVEVRYEKIYASFGIWRKGWAFLHYFHEAVEPDDCEVIGNIHDKK